MIATAETTEEYDLHADGQWEDITTVLDVDELGLDTSGRLAGRARPIRIVAKVDAGAPSHGLARERPGVAVE